MNGQTDFFSTSLGPGAVPTQVTRTCPEFRVGATTLQTTAVFETYWRFAAERQRMFFRRLRGEWPATADPILGAHRFTNAYRASDRVSQYLIGTVIPGCEEDPRDIFFRTILFKTFNSIGTWMALESAVGPLHLRGYSFAAYDAALEAIRVSGKSVYSNAYMMPIPPFGHVRKHSNHLRLIEHMLQVGLVQRLASVASYANAYGEICAMPSLGKFLAFQYAVDLNYGPLLPFDEADFVVAGPGALDGIRKCFGFTGYLPPEDVIHAMAQQADQWFRFFGIDFPDLWGRPLQPIDVQNLFCEVDKYSRRAHPEIAGISGRTQIKQTYRPDHSPLVVTYPGKWGLAGEVLGVPAPA